MNILYQNSLDHYCTDDCSHSIKREYGATPNGNPLNGRWVLRINNVLVDFDKYRNDLVERYNLTLKREIER